MPLLRTYPFIRVWHAGCSTGEEVYSTAIMLEEEGLLERSRIYATDINDAVLQQARDGIFPLNRMQEYTENYIRAGGTTVVLRVLHGEVRRRAVQSIAHAQRRVLAAQPRHRPVVQRVQCHLLSERAHLFRPRAAESVHALFYESLVTFGILALGSKESLRFSQYEPCYEKLDAREKLYRKVR